MDGLDETEACGAGGDCNGEAFWCHAAKVGEGLLAGAEVSSAGKRSAGGAEGRKPLI